jgi:hypothetical protein
VAIVGRLGSRHDEPKGSAPCILPQVKKEPRRKPGLSGHRRKISLTVLSLHRNGIPVLLPFGGTRLPERHSRPHDFANAAIAASRVGSCPCAARSMSPLWPLAHFHDSARA